MSRQAVHGAPEPPVSPKAEGSGVSHLGDAMPRIRTLKPECLQHRKVGKLHYRAFRLWVAMILQADDEGRLVADLEQLRAVVFAYHARVKITDIDAALGELTRVGLVRRYTLDGVAYADFPSWHDHQKIDRPRPSMLPCFSEYTGLREDSSSPREDSSSPRSDRKGSEGIGREGIRRCVEPSRCSGLALTRSASGSLQCRKGTRVTPRDDADDRATATSSRAAQEISRSGLLGERHARKIGRASCRERG